MERNIEQHLNEWKQNPRRKPLIIRGARQVGKTFIIEKFGKNNFEYYFYLNLEQESNLLSVFESKNPQNIINELTALYSIPIINGKTLLFIDEIQFLPEAIASLRYFYEQIPDLHIIAAGSLLDHTLNEIQYSMPIGRVEYAYMFPLNFQEFLTALGENELCNYINSYMPGTNFSEAIHKKITDYLRLYFFIGGMPEAIQTYIDTKNLLEVEKIHANILTSLQYDFAKYGSRQQQGLLKSSLQYVANNIGRKVKYVNIDRNVHSTQLKEALLKLEMSRVIHLVRRTKSFNPPITQYADNENFKPLFIDIGLTCHLAQIKLNNIKTLTTDFEGALAEQFVGQEFIASFAFYKETKLYYWVREAKNSNAEIDYLFQKDNEIYPVEVKAGKTGTLKSMQVYLSEKNKQKGIRLNMDIPNYGHNLKAKIRIKNKEKNIVYSLLSLPLYFAGYLGKIKL
ncbi:MAG: ATP-binding protein [Chlorobi bacterium]|nr:ATP-binding protein [Chlorobiota bacterium]